MIVRVLKCSCKTKKLLYSILFFSILAMSSCKEQPKESESVKEVAAINYLEESTESFDERMRWWRDARFGMFIHWGPYSVPAGIPLQFPSRNMKNMQSSSIPRNSTQKNGPGQ